MTKTEYRQIAKVLNEILADYPQAHLTTGTLIFIIANRLCEVFKEKPNFDSLPFIEQATTGSGN